MANFKTNIKATNYELTNDIRNYIDHQISKFGKVLPHNTEEIILDVEVGKETEHHIHGPIYRAEFNMKYKNQFKRATATKNNLKEAIDLAADDLIRQVRTNKEKTTDMVRRGAAKVKKWMRLGK